MITRVFGRRGGEGTRKLVAAELAVTGVAHTGDDVAAFIQVRVHGADENFDVGLGAGELAETFRGGEKAELFDAGDAPLFKALDGNGGGAAGGEHGIDKESNVNGLVVGEFVVIFDGFKGAFVAKEAEVEYAGVGRSSRSPSTIPSPARRTGTRPILPMGRAPKVRARGVVTGTR